VASKIRILLVDDHAIVRHGYRTLLEKQPDLEIIGEAADAAEAYTRFQTLAPDLTIMDLSLPDASGIEAIARLRQWHGSAKVLVFTMHRHPTFAVQATRAGALGYITKSSAPDVLVRAVYDVWAGKHVLSPDIAQALAITKLKGEHGPLDELSHREFEILRLLTGGRTTQEIADVLHISPKTVANGHYEIKRKLGVRSDIELVHLALRLQVIDLLETGGA
jgi:two-component system, NarL family, invasion response regulator UvrY